jgi:hypothetical protein
MRIVFIQDATERAAVIKSATHEGQVPRAGEWVSATDKDGTVKGYVRLVEWKYESINGPEVRVFLNL